MSFHFCPLDSDCRRFGAVWRLHVGTKRHHYVLALRPGDRVQKPGTHWTEMKFVWFARRPVSGVHGH